MAFDPIRSFHRGIQEALKLSRVQRPRLELAPLYAFAISLPCFRLFERSKSIEETVAGGLLERKFLKSRVLLTCVNEGKFHAALELRLIPFLQENLEGWIRRSRVVN